MQYRQVVSAADNTVCQPDECIYRVKMSEQCVPEVKAMAIMGRGQVLWLWHLGHNSMSGHSSAQILTLNGNRRLVFKSAKASSTHLEVEQITCYKRTQTALSLWRTPKHLTNLIISFQPKGSVPCSLADQSPVDVPWILNKKRLHMAARFLLSTKAQKGKLHFTC